MNEYVIRFSLRQRAEHLCVMVLFTVLALTGLAQKFRMAGWALWTIAAMGGIDRTRALHRGAGVLFAALAVFHLAGALVLVGSGRARPSMVPTRKDFRDAVATMRYYMRLSDAQERFDRFDYRQKFEYWGLVLGSMLMIVTGFMLYFPVLVTRVLPGEFIPAAKIAHSGEGLLAFLVVLIWHIFNAHLAPEVFPFDPSVFTGRLSRERMEKEHPLEYERMCAGGQEQEREVRRDALPPGGEAPGPDGRALRPMKRVTVRQRVRHSLRARIVLMTMAGTLAPIAIVAWLSRSGVSSLESQVLAERRRLATSLAVHFDSLMESELSGLERISPAPVLGVGDAGPVPRASLGEACLRSRILSHVFLLDREGNAVAAEPAARPGFVGPPRDLASLRQTLVEKATPEISALWVGPDGTHRLFLLVPLTNLQGQAAGVVGGEIQPESPRFRSILNFVPLEPGETIDLVDQHGIVIASTAGSRLYTPGDHRHFLEGLELTAFAPLSRRVPWGISIRQPQAGVFAAARAMRLEILVWVPALVVLSLLLALGAAASIVAPLSLLTRAAGRIAGGELATAIPELGVDEVGQLGAALEQMRVALRQSLEEVVRARDQLELRVEERTREIERLYQELKQRDQLRARLIEKLIGAQEDERRRIARELHDDTSQIIGALALGLDTAIATLPAGASSDRLQEARALAVRTLDGIHRMTFDLRPSVLDDLGLFPAIEWYAQRDLERRGIAVRCECDDSGGRLPAEIETALFRAVQEAITNIVKHAHAETVLIQYVLGEKAVTIEIEDDGEGFDPAGISAIASDGRGLGLAGIRERVELLGGTAVIDSAPGRGTRVVLTVPLQSDDHG
ncbi:MAG: ATP-binding protein [Candidatus Binataceae bacterium]